MIQVLQAFSSLDNLWVQIQVVRISTGNNPALSKFSCSFKLSKHVSSLIGLQTENGWKCRLRGYLFLFRTSVDNNFFLNIQTERFSLHLIPFYRFHISMDMIGTLSHSNVSWSFEWIKKIYCIQRSLMLKWMIHMSRFFLANQKHTVLPGCLIHERFDSKAAWRGERYRIPKQWLLRVPSF